MTTTTTETTPARNINVDQAQPILLVAYDSAQGVWFPVDSVAGVLKTTGGGVGGGGATSILDGADVAEGSITDAPWVSGNGTIISLLKKIASASPGGGGGGGAVSIAEGADITTGTTTDAAITTNAVGTVSGKLRGLVTILASVWDNVGGRLKVDGSAVTQPVSGTVGVSNFPATQTVSGTVGVTGTIGVSNFPATQSVSGTVAVSNTVPVTGTFWQATQPVSGAVSVSNFPVTQAVSGTFWQATQPVNGIVSATQNGVWNIGSISTLPSLVAGAAVIGGVTQSGIWTLAQGTANTVANAWPTKLTDGTNTVAVKAASTPATATDTALVVALSPASPAYHKQADLAVTVTAAANTAATLTLPAPAAGLFHYITRIEITRTATAALTGTATLVITSTNLPGTIAWSVGNAMTAGGTQKDVDINFTHPVKSSAAAIATTIVCPAPGAAVLWRATAYYYTA